MNFRKKVLVVAVSSAIFIVGCSSQNIRTYSSVDELKAALHDQIATKEKELRLARIKSQNLNTEYQELRALNERANQINAQVSTSRYPTKKSHIAYTYSPDNQEMNPQLSPVKVIPVSPKMADFQRVRSRIEAMNKKRIRFNETDDVPEIPLLNQPNHEQEPIKDSTQATYKRPVKPNKPAFIQASYNPRMQSDKALPNLGQFTAKKNLKRKINIPRKNVVKKQLEKNVDIPKIKTAVYKRSDNAIFARPDLYKPTYLKTSDYVYKFKSLPAFGSKSSKQPITRVSFKTHKTMAKTPKRYIKRKISNVYKNKFKAANAKRGLRKGTYFNVAYVMKNRNEVNAMNEMLKLYNVKDIRTSKREGDFRIYLGVFKYSQNAKKRLQEMASLTGKMPTVSKRRIN